MATADEDRMVPRPLATRGEVDAYNAAAVLLAVVTVILGVGVRYATSPAGGVFLFGLGLGMLLLSVACWGLGRAAASRLCDQENADA